MNETVQITNWTPELLAAAKQALKAQAEIEKASRERLRKVRQAAFEETLPSFELFLADVEATHEVQTWHKKDKSGQPTSEVRANGFYVNGKATVTVAGRQRQVTTTTFVQWSPTGGSAPEDLNAQQD